MSRKTLERAALKAHEDDQHTIEFYALAFGTEPDKQGDIIAPNAADEWLMRFYAAGQPLPISFTHAAVKGAAHDPFSVIGYAPADPMHVYKDAHGIRVRAYLDTETNPTAKQVYALTHRGIITGASLAYFTTPEGQQMNTDGSVLITKIEDILEAGPCLDPANESAYVLAVKNMEELETKAVDSSGWDGNRAMGQCSSASDYRSICAGERTTGEPDERQHWALPHHYLGRGPNAAGVRNALARLPQTQGLKNASAAESHLRAHMSSISPQAASNEGELRFSAHELIELMTKAGRVISAANMAKLRAADEVIHDLLSFGDEVNADIEIETAANEEEPETANSEEPSGPNDWLRDALAKATA